jgi:elongation factor Ts
MTISAALVKELRERTGAGMMECKKALEATGGDIGAAVEHMRKAGLAKADKKAGRIAAEGQIAIETADDGSASVLVEVNCETDFVTKEPVFKDFVAQVARRALEAGPADVEALSALPADDDGGPTLDERRRELVARIGENITIRRYARLESRDGLISTYLHQGARIGVGVELHGGDAQLAKDIAMHVAASRPVCVAEDQVPAELIAKEKEIYAAQAATSGKPAEIIDKMVTGRVQKFLKEITLLGQPFVRNPEVTVDKHLRTRGAQVRRFVRFEVGEGIEKKSANFADEVMAQVRGAKA